MKIFLSCINITILTFLSFNLHAQGQGQQSMASHGDELGCQLTSQQVLKRTPSEEETNTLLFMREEEKMARDIYNELFNQWPSNVFMNIAESEQKHMDKVKVFLDGYDLNDPAKVESGSFSNQDIQALYNELIAKGNQSELDAFKVGALVEEVDIDDLQNAVVNTEDEQLRSMYTQLLLASHNHLRAFSNQIIKLEGEYVAQFMSSEDVSIILEGEHSAMNSGNTNLLDTTGNINENNACVITSISNDEGSVQNGNSVRGEEIISISQRIMVDQADVNQAVDWLVMVSYQPENSDLRQLFVRSGDTWQAWNGTLSNFPAAGNTQQIAEKQTLSVFNGQLREMLGVYLIYSGFRLENGSIVYNRLPTLLKVIE